MIGFLKKYKHFAFGFGITFVMAISLESLGILVNVSMNEEGLFGFLLQNNQYALPHLHYFVMISEMRNWHL